MKREGSLSFLMIFTFIVPELGALYFIQCHRKILVMYDGISLGNFVFDCDGSSKYSNENFED